MTPIDLPSSKPATDPLQLPLAWREERIANNESRSRSLNERRAGWASGRGEMTGFRCECWQDDCEERIPLSAEDWKMVRAEPNRFAVAPHHVAESFEAVITAFSGFWMVEKFGEAGKVAEEHDARIEGRSRRRVLAETGGRPEPCPRCKGTGSEPERGAKG